MGSMDIALDVDGYFAINQGLLFKFLSDDEQIRYVDTRDGEISRFPASQNKDWRGKKESFRHGGLFVYCFFFLFFLLLSSEFGQPGPFAGVRSFKLCQNAGEVAVGGIVVIGGTPYPAGEEGYVRYWPVLSSLDCSDD